MNRTATTALALLLAVAASLVAWRGARPGPHYAQVLHATPVTVREPRYVDVVDAVPVGDDDSRPGKVRAWVVAYRAGGRMLHTRVAHEPGDQIQVGEQRRVIGYDVVWRWRDRTGVARVNVRPGKHLPVVDGAVVEARRPGFPPPST